MIGIDGDKVKDTLIGVLTGVGFVAASQMSVNFVLGLPTVAASLSDLGWFAVSVLLAPLAEEGLFRGLVPAILHLMVDKPKSLKSSWVDSNKWFLFNILQAVLFAGFHAVAYGAGFQTAFFGAFIFGLIAGVLVKMTHSLWPGMLTHAIFNGYLFLTQVVSIGGG